MKTVVLNSTDLSNAPLFYAGARGVGEGAVGEVYETEDGDRHIIPFRFTRDSSKGFLGNLKQIGKLTLETVAGGLVAGPVGAVALPVAAETGLQWASNTTYNNKLNKANARITELEAQLAAQKA